ncbi:hypothetical protein EV175_003322 [Coemansia sp. RSA 1933]|nr:hypothetical protein EV175_003322 [Coemansia sp. RSA 1933]
MLCKWHAVAAFAAAFGTLATPVYGGQTSQDVTITGSRLQQEGCTHPIYCDGPILKAVQLCGVFDDDKTFVDMPTRKPVDVIVAEFYLLPDNATKSELSQFVSDNFYPAGSDIVEAELVDWTDNPPFLEGVTDPVLRGYGMAIHNQWKTMARKCNTSFLCAGCETSLLPANNVFFTTGDESSREFHYWNTYYIVIGLLKSGLYTTAKGVLQNLLDMVETYGFVPTGGRIYYTDRSEPPLLALMVQTYYEATQDLDFVVEALPLLMMEHEFWELYRSVDITYTNDSTYNGLGKRQSDSGSSLSAKVATYGPDLFSSTFNNSTLLRPELYSSDYQAAKTQTNAPNLFSSLTGSDLYAASESGTSPGVQNADLKEATQGPDLFSRRSLSRRDIEIPSTNPFAAFTEPELIVLGSTQINSTIAVNLNSIIYQAEIIIADFIQLVNGSATTECVSYRSRAAERRQTLIDLTYDADTGLFSDYHLATGSKTDIWSMSSLWPYWAFGDSLPSGSAQMALENIEFLHQKFPGGLPNTLYNSSLPWDYPYIQPPMQHMAVSSAQNAENYACASSNSTSSASCGGTAAKIAQSTVNSAFCNWYTTGGSISDVLNSYENAPAGSSGTNFGSFSIGSDGNIVTTTSSSSGSQGGFAWTNGINIWLLDNYKTQLQMPSCPNIKLNLVEQTTSYSSAVITSTQQTSYPASTPLSVSTSTEETGYPVSTPSEDTGYPESTPAQQESSSLSRRSCVRKRVCRRCYRTVTHKWVSRNGGADCKNPRARK